MAEDTTDEVTGDEKPEIPGVSDRKEKNVTILDRAGNWTDYTEVYLAHDDDAFVVSEDDSFPEDDRTHYAKEDVMRLRVDQHHPSLCFITTAAAGEGPTLDTLRDFRDDALEPSALGHGLVRFYYAVSPPVAATIERHPESRTRRVVEQLVDAAAWLADRREERTAWQRTALTAVVTLVYVVGMLLALGGHVAIRTQETLEYLSSRP